MSGPKTTRSDINTAPLPGLTPQLENLLKNFAASGMQGLPFGQPSDLQRQTSGAYGNMLSNIGSMGGQGVLDAAQPIFGRNLQQGADVLRQSGPRFASNTERLVGDMSNKALQDFNLFAQQAMLQGQQNQLAALTGAGGFANQMQGQQNDIMSQLLGMLGNLGAGPAALVQHKGTAGDIAGILGGIGGVASAAGGIGNMFGGGGGTGDPLAGEGALTGDTGPYGGAGGAGTPFIRMDGMTGGVAPMPGWNRAPWGHSPFGGFNWGMR